MTTDDATMAAFGDPQSGDHFHEMYTFHAFVVAVEPEGRVAVLTVTPPCTLPRGGKLEIYASHDAYRAAFAYKTIPGYWVRLGKRGVNVAGWFAGWPRPFGDPGRQ